MTPFQGVQGWILAIDPDVHDEMLVGLNLRDRRLHDVYRLDLENGALELDTENPGDVADWTADNALRVRAAQVNLPDGSVEIRVRDDAGAP